MRKGNKYYHVAGHDDSHRLQAIQECDSFGSPTFSAHGGERPWRLVVAASQQAKPFTEALNMATLTCRLTAKDIFDMLFYGCPVMRFHGGFDGRRLR